MRHSQHRQMQGRAKGWMIHRLQKGQNDGGWPRYLFLRLYVRLEGFILQNAKIPTVKYVQATKNYIKIKNNLTSYYCHIAIVDELCTTCLKWGWGRHTWLVSTPMCKKLSSRRDHNPTRVWSLSTFQDKHFPHQIMYFLSCVFSSPVDQKAHCLTLSCKYSSPKKDYERCQMRTTGIVNLKLL